MAEDSKLSLHVDSDWKKQAQEEKRRLAEQEASQKQKQQSAAATPMGVMAGPAATKREAAARRGETPRASLETLIQSIVTQVLFYLGDLASRGGEPVVNLDMAKHNLDTLAVLENKTRGNLQSDEQKSLDAALYEARMRFIAVASRYAELP